MVESYREGNAQVYRRANRLIDSLSVMQHAARILSHRSSSGGLRLLQHRLESVEEGIVGVSLQYEGGGVRSRAMREIITMPCHC